ncbi:Nuclear pore complex protein Nup98-Nup96, partial [Ophiophagus hannah]
IVSRDPLGAPPRSGWHKYPHQCFLEHLGLCLPYWALGGGIVELDALMDPRKEKGAPPPFPRPLPRLAEGEEGAKGAPGLFGSFHRALVVVAALPGHHPHSEAWQLVPIYDGRSLPGVTWPPFGHFLTSRQLWPERSQNGAKLTPKLPPLITDALGSVVWEAEPGVLRELPPQGRGAATEWEAEPGVLRELPPQGRSIGVAKQDHCWTEGEAFHPNRPRPVALPFRGGGGLNDVLWDPNALLKGLIFTPLGKQIKNRVGRGLVHPPPKFSAAAREGLELLVTPPSSPFKVHLEKLTLDSKPTDRVYLPPLEIKLKHSTVHLDDPCPFLAPDPGVAAIHEYAAWASEASEDAGEGEEGERGVACGQDHLLSRAGSGWEGAWPRRTLGLIPGFGPENKGSRPRELLCSAASHRGHSFQALSDSGPLSACHSRVLVPNGPQPSIGPVGYEEDDLDGDMGAQAKGPRRDRKTIKVLFLEPVPIKAAFGAPGALGHWDCMAWPPSFDWHQPGKAPSELLLLLLLKVTQAVRAGTCFPPGSSFLLLDQGPPKLGSLKTCGLQLPGAGWRILGVEMDSCCLLSATTYLGGQEEPQNSQRGPRGAGGKQDLTLHWPAKCSSQGGAEGYPGSTGFPLLSKVLLLREPGFSLSASGRQRGSHGPCDRRKYEPPGKHLNLDQVTNGMLATVVGVRKGAFFQCRCNLEQAVCETSRRERSIRPGVARLTNAHGRSLPAAVVRAWGLVWRLCEALWGRLKELEGRLEEPGEYGLLLERRRAFSRWLSRTAAQRIQEESASKGLPTPSSPRGAYPPHGMLPREAWAGKRGGFHIGGNPPPPSSSLGAPCSLPLPHSCPAASLGPFNAQQERTLNTERPPLWTLRYKHICLGNGHQQLGNLDLRWFSWEAKDAAWPSPIRRRDTHWAG